MEIFLAGEENEVFGVGAGGSKWFIDNDMAAGGEALAGDGVVGGVWGANGN